MTWTRPPPFCYVQESTWYICCHARTGNNNIVSFVRAVNYCICCTSVSDEIHAVFLTVQGSLWFALLAVIEHDGVVATPRDDQPLGLKSKSFHGTPWRCGSSAALCWSASGRRLPTMTRSWILRRRFRSRSSLIFTLMMNEWLHTKAPPLRWDERECVGLKLWPTVEQNKALQFLKYIRENNKKKYICQSYLK